MLIHNRLYGLRVANGQVLRNPQKKNLTVHLHNSEYGIERSRVEDSSYQAVTLWVALEQVCCSLTALFMWSINSDSFKSVVRVEPAFASRYLLSVSWVDNNVCSKPLPVIKIRTIRTNNKPLTLVINTNIN